MRHLAGKSISPWSACNSPRSMPNRLDLPAPLAPIRPILSPGLRVRSTDSSSGLVPRIRLTLIKRIMRDFLYKLFTQLVGGQQKHHVVARRGGHPGQAQVAESRFRVLPLIADFDHQDAVRGQVVGGAVDDLAH